jgi:prepilin-type N-terminal cleavage/methylation domain-containing protein
MSKKRPAFTLIEIIVSTILLSIVLIGLYSVLDTQRRSVINIKKNLDKSMDHDRAIMALYDDLLQSDGNLTIKKGERDTLCINSTTHSLYELGVAKVCWLVLKDKDTLIRVEGNDYKLPLGLEDSVEVDRVLEGVSAFEVVRDKDLIFVYAQQLKKEPYSFLLQGIKQPPKPKPKKKKKPKKPNNLKGNSNQNQNKPKSDANTTKPPGIESGLF